MPAHFLSVQSYPVYRGKKYLGLVGHQNIIPGHKRTNLCHHCYQRLSILSGHNLCMLFHHYKGIFQDIFRIQFLCLRKLFLWMSSVTSGTLCSYNALEIRGKMSQLDFFRSSPFHKNRFWWRDGSDYGVINISLYIIQFVVCRKERRILAHLNAEKDC